MDYHNLTHLLHIYKELIPIKPKIKNWDVLCFGIFYHDYVYNITKSNNEAQSANCFAKRYQDVLPKRLINKTKQLILETKTHETSNCKDIAYFLDADISIFGASRTPYLVYAKNIRQEYYIYPNWLYKKGRKRVLQHFLDSQSLYQTEEFRAKYETKARENLKFELYHLL